MQKFILLPQAMKIPDALAAVDKQWEKLEKLPAWQMSNHFKKEELESVEICQKVCSQIVF